jgi:hypothetical protein
MLNGKNGHGKKEAALWQCSSCGSWWCSQPEVEATRFMLDLPGETLEELGWENFRGWRLGGTPHVGTCPECGTLALKPRFGSASAGMQLQLDLAELLRPVLAPAG